ncbi:MAG: Gfo/Idh/MocA family protein [Puniceicoccales bacterium]
MLSKRLRWGILGPGTIAHKFAAGLAESKTGVLHSAASRDESRAKAFLKEYGGGQAYGDYQELLNDPDVDAVYIATPHPLHAQWAIQAARAGKHILCEKPATMNLAEMKAVAAAVKSAGVAFLEAFMYRSHPYTAQWCKLVASGAIGSVRRITAHFAFDCGDQPESRLQAKHLGGGGILDIGCYTTSACRLIAGAAHGKAFLNPTELKAIGHLLDTTGVDGWTTALMRFDGDILAEAHCAVRLHVGSGITVYGSKGVMTITEPWFANGKIIVKEHQGEAQEIKSPPARHLYSYEIDALAEIVQTGQTPYPAMSLEDTLGNMETLDRWRQELGLTYECDVR